MVTVREPCGSHGSVVLSSRRKEGTQCLMVTSAVSEDRVVRAAMTHPPRGSAWHAPWTPSGGPGVMRAKLGFPMDSLVTSGVLTALKQCS